MFKNVYIGVAGVAQLEHCFVYQRVMGSIPGKGTYLGYGFHPWSGLKRQPINVSALSSHPTWPPNLVFFPTALNIYLFIASAPPIV